MRQSFKWLAIALVGFLGLAIIVSIMSPSESEPPHQATPSPDIVDFTVTREWELPAGGYGAELRVDDTATKDEVIGLGHWLLRGDSDVLMHINNSAGRTAVVRRLFDDDGRGDISWFEAGQLVESISLDGGITRHAPRP